MKHVLWKTINLLFFVNPLSTLNTLKFFLLRKFGADLGRHIQIKAGVSFRAPWNLEIGDNVIFDEWSRVDSYEKIMILDNVYIGKGVHISTRLPNKPSHLPLIIENNVVLEARSKVWGGVICRTHSVLKINSEAVGPLDSYSVYQGKPAVFTEKRFAEN